MAMGKFPKWVVNQGGPESVAKKLGVTAAAVRYWLRGEYAPRTSTAINIIRLSRGRLALADIIKSCHRNA